MKKWMIIVIFCLLVISGFFVFNNLKISGGVVNDFEENKNQFGPSQDSVQCMSQCMGCSSPGVNCTGNQEQCMSECNLQAKPEAKDEGEKCMQDCVLIGCGEFDFSCQNKNKGNCEEKCEMNQEPDESEMSAEQLCITNCVKSIDEKLICGNSQEGETGNSVCQKCAADCVHLYEGPCLDDNGVKAKQKDCETCEHCYGEPAMGDSGEGWECIVDVECKDASSEFGDDPGEGPDSYEEGHEPGIVTKAFEAIGNFFSNLFGGNKE